MGNGTQAVNTMDVLAPAYAVSGSTTRAHGLLFTPSMRLDILIACDAAIIVLFGLVMTYATHAHMPLVFGGAVLQILQFALLFAIAVHFVLHRGGYYALRTIQLESAGLKDFAGIASRVLGAGLAVFTVALSLRLPLEFSPTTLLIWIIVSAVAIAAHHRVVASFIRAAVPNGLLSQRIAVYGDRALRRRVVDALSATQPNLCIIGEFGGHQSLAPCHDTPSPRDDASGTFEDLIAASLRGEIDHVIFALPKTESV